MGKAAKIVSTKDGHLTKEEREIRSETEAALRGGTDKLKPPSYLTATQKKIFKFILTEMEASGFYGNLDVFILTQFSICADRLAELERLMNENADERFTKGNMSARATYSKDFTKYAIELCLSPQARAKAGGFAAAAGKKEKAVNPIMKIIGG